MAVKELKEIRQAMEERRRESLAFKAVLKDRTTLDLTAMVDFLRVAGAENKGRIEALRAQLGQVRAELFAAEAIALNTEDQIEAIYDELDGREVD
jgi:hypothetical protein